MTGVIKHYISTNNTSLFSRIDINTEQFPNRYILSIYVFSRSSTKIRKL